MRRKPKWTMAQIEGMIDVMPQPQRDQYRCAYNVLVALLTYGPIRNFGGLFVAGPLRTDLRNQLRINGGEMHDAVRLLAKHGFNVMRQDSGGSPTWDLE